MLALRSLSGSSDKCSVNVLPCRIHKNGSVKVTKRYWAPKSDADGHQTSYFRGRKLRGRVLRIPEGYQGIVAKSTEQVLPQQKSTPIRIASFEDDEVEEIAEDETPEPVKVMDGVASFDEVIVWGHDQLPADDDPFQKGISEWIAFAGAIHRPVPAEHLEKKTA